jgi:hypothetical protein
MSSEPKTAKDAYEGLTAEFEKKLELKFGTACLALVQAVADICNAMAAREVEKLRTQCREFSEDVYDRLERIEGIMGLNHAPDRRDPKKGVVVRFAPRAASPKQPAEPRD